MDQTEETTAWESNPKEFSHKPVFSMGDVVVLRSTPETSGAVTGVISDGPEIRYSVFINGRIQTFYESQLIMGKSPDNLTHFTSLSEFHSRLTALQLLHPSLDSLYSLRAARISFVPYQFLPAIKFIRAERPRLLIADGVGVGKTIEAGLILRELQARREIRSVLIICPKALVVERKWELEMRRFDERFTSLDGPNLRYCIKETDLDGIWPEQHAKTIIPYSLFDETLLFGDADKKRRKSQKALMDLDPPPHFDLLIVDESHHIRNTQTYAYRAIRFFTENAEAAIFLSATPIQLGNDDLFNQLHLLRPDIFLNKQTFERMTQPNPHVNAAVNFVRLAQSRWQSDALCSLNEAADTEWGRDVLKNDPEFERVVQTLEAPEISPRERVYLTSDIEALHTLSGLINRTRRRDIGNFTIRKPETVTVEFTAQQQLLHDKLLETQADILRERHGDRSVKFMMTTLRRQAASCLYGLKSMIARIDHLSSESLDETDLDVDVESFDQSSWSDLGSKFGTLTKAFELLDTDDPKLEALKKIIYTKQKMKNNKLMVFSSFRHTLAYLLEHLVVEGFRIGQIHGGVPDHERVNIREQFKKERSEFDAIDVLLFSEVGAEGLDYQFCDCIVNYDLPWNPMRVEQRIGRIDRWGQQSESVAIYNLITPGTVDADIYERCLLRIGIFNNALGASEEILGEISREIRDVAENLTLSNQDRQKKLQQIADNKIRLIRAEDDLENQQGELFGIGSIQKTEKQIEESQNPWISARMIENLVSFYLTRIIGGQQQPILGEKPLKTLRLSLESRAKLLVDFEKLPVTSSVTHRDWERWLKGSQPNLSITFDSSCASENQKAIFITPVHPLSKQAAQALTNEFVVFATAVQVEDFSIEAGMYPFSIYQWRYQGLGSDATLKPVCENVDVLHRFFELLDKATAMECPETIIPSAKTFDMLDAKHHQMWIQAREEHITRTQKLAGYKIKSLSGSHAARISLLRDQLTASTDERIIKMRQSQISNAEADYARRLKEISNTSDKGDILTERIAYGVIKVIGGLGGKQL